MKVLFVLSGNSASDSTIKEMFLIKNAKHQGDSLISMGYNIDYYFIKGKGILGYLKNIPGLRNHIKRNKYNVIHAHYSLTAILTSFTTLLPIVVSLMGSDVMQNKFMLLIIRLFCKYRWTKVIVKTDYMQNVLNCKNVYVIPNGVDLNIFKPLDKILAREEIKVSKFQKIVLFASDINRKEKNYQLAQKSFEHLLDKNIILLPIYNISHNRMVYYFNACDVLLLTSLWEGSVNVVKEAMACNTKVISTDVGDVKRNINGVPGYYLATFEPVDIAHKITEALSYNGPVDGRKRIEELKLDIISTNNRIIELYKDLQINSAL